MKVVKNRETRRHTLVSFANDTIQNCFFYNSDQTSDYEQFHEYFLFFFNDIKRQNEEVATRLPKRDVVLLRALNCRD